MDEAMSDFDDLKEKIQTLLVLMEAESEKNDVFREIRFKTELMWRAFIGGVGLIILSVIGALAALVIRS